MADRELAFRKRRGAQYEAAMMAKRLSKSELAGKCEVSPRTISNLFNGERVSRETISDVSRALGVEPMFDTSAETADEAHGSYQRHLHGDYEGAYFMFRKSYSETDKIFQSIMLIRWDEERSLLQFEEGYQSKIDGPDDVKKHRGDVFVSAHTGLVHLLTVDRGALRLLTVTRMTHSEKIMRGCVLTQQPSYGTHWPTVSPIVLCKIKQYDLSNLAEDIGLIGADHERFDFANEQMKITETKITRIISSSLAAAQ